MSHHVKFSVLFLVIFAALAACQPKQKHVDSVQAAPAEEMKTALPAVAPLTEKDVFGRWDIVSFDGFTPPSRLNSEGVRSAYVDFIRENADRFEAGFNIGCHPSTGKFRLNQDSAVLTISAVETVQAGLPAEKDCDPDVIKRQDALLSMMDKSPRIERANNGLRTWTDNHELILLNSRIGQQRNSLLIEDIYGDWNVTKAIWRGVVFDGNTLLKDRLTISEEKIQYGNKLPYLSRPRHISSGSIKGVIIDGNEGKREDEIRPPVIDCRGFSKIGFRPEPSENNAMCTVLYTYSLSPVAEPLESPDEIRLAVPGADVRLILKRSKS